MNLIFLYGPPGVGKLTVAKALSKLTGYKLFHNHLSVDLVHSLFPFGVKEYADLTRKIRLDLLEAAARYKLEGVVFTFVYGVETLGGKTDDASVKKIIQRVKKHGGKVLFIKLTCDKKELHRRLRHPSRKSFKKLTSIKVFKEIEKKHRLNETIPFVKSQIIDTTDTSPRKAAEMIRKHYRL